MKIDWCKVWREFGAWFDNQDGLWCDPEWSKQRRKIVSLVNAQLAPRKKAKR